MNEDKMNFNDIVGTDNVTYSEQQTPDVSQAPDISTQLENAAQEGNKEEVENIVEENPIESQEVLDNDKGNELNTEAEQITDSNEKNVEVRNEAVEDFIEDEQAKPGSSFLNNSGVNWDNVKVYQPGEDSYGAVDPYNKNAPDYVPSTEKPERDEDFLGPDEYIDENGKIQTDINWKPGDADEDFLGPDEYIDENGEIQVKDPENETVPEMSVDGTVEEAIDAQNELDGVTNEDYMPEEEELPTEEEVEEAIKEVENIPVTSAAGAKDKQKLLSYFRGLPTRHVASTSFSSSPTTEQRLANAGMSTGGALGRLGTPSGIGGGVSSSGYGSGAKGKTSGTEPVMTKTGGGTAPVESATTDSVSSVKPATNKFSNGTLSSGASGLMSNRKNSALKVQKAKEVEGETRSTDGEESVLDQMLENGQLNGILNDDAEIEKLKQELEAYLLRERK